LDVQHHWYPGTAAHAPHSLAGVPGVGGGVGGGIGVGTGLGVGGVGLGVGGVGLGVGGVGLGVGGGVGRHSPLKHLLPGLNKERHGLSTPVGHGSAPAPQITAGPPFGPIPGVPQKHVF
jgi:hypothetical protein